MPKVKKKEPPPIDWLWAVVLERKAASGMTLKEMADLAGVSYPTMRNYSLKSPWDWPRPMRERLCKSFGININVMPQNADLEVKIG